MTRVTERTASEPRARRQDRDLPATHRRAAGVLRIVAAGLVIATGAIHLYLYQHVFSSVPTIGRLFLANFAVAVVVGGIVLLRPRRVWCLLAAGVCVATLGAFLVSVHWGLFGYRETLHGAWQERAASVEVAGALTCTWLGLLRRA